MDVQLTTMLLYSVLRMKSASTLTCEVHGWLVAGMELAFGHLHSTPSSFG